MARHCAANWPRKRERQDGDRPGHTGLSESLIWDSDDMPSLQHPLSRALELYIGEEGAYVKTDCNEKKCARQSTKDGYTNSLPFLTCFPKILNENRVKNDAN